jgi:hypothetical protein
LVQATQVQFFPSQGLEHHFAKRIRADSPDKGNVASRTGCRDGLVRSFSTLSHTEICTQHSGPWSRGVGDIGGDVYVGISDHNDAGLGYLLAPNKDPVVLSPGSIAKQ